MNDSNFSHTLQDCKASAAAHIPRESGSQGGIHSPEAYWHIATALNE